MERLPGRKRTWSMSNNEPVPSDFTIVAEGKEIKTHRVVLTSNSEYFKKLFSEEESCSNRIELKGLTATAVSKTIACFYANHNPITNNIPDILEAALYLQAPSVVNRCKGELPSWRLTIKDCFKVLSIWTKYSVHEEVEEVDSFIRRRWNDIVQGCNVSDITYEGLQILLECWEKSEWTLFLYINSWLNYDFETRKVHMNDLMSNVRFCLIPPGKVASIEKWSKNAAIKRLNNTWFHLMHEAEGYHRQPIHLKVLNKSTQNTVRNEPEPIVLATDGATKDVAQSTMYTLKKGYNKDADSSVGGPLVPWVRRKIPKAPEFTEVQPQVIEINNFLIVCNGHGINQRWHVFDPRNLTWTDMPGMLTAKTGFAMAHYESKLYTFGGHLGSNSEIDSILDDVQEYNWETNTWRTAKKMPAAVTKHSACTFGDAIFVSGGVRDKADETATTNTECFNVKTRRWKKKAPMKKAAKDHKLHVVTFDDENVILAIELNKFQYYEPESDQWTLFFPSCLPDPILSDDSLHPEAMVSAEWCSNGTILANGNTLFPLNIYGYFQVDYSDVDDEDIYNYDSKSYQSYKKYKRSRKYKRRKARCAYASSGDESDDDVNYGGFGSLSRTQRCAFYTSDSDSDSDENAKKEPSKLERTCARWQLPSRDVIASDEEQEDYGTSIRLQRFPVDNAGEWSLPGKDFCAAMLALGGKDCCPGGEWLCQLCKGQQRPENVRENGPLLEMVVNSTLRQDNML